MPLSLPAKIFAPLYSPGESILHFLLTIFAQARREARGAMTSHVPKSVAPQWCIKIAVQPHIVGNLAESSESVPSCPWARKDQSCNLFAARTLVSFVACHVLVCDPFFCEASSAQLAAEDGEAGFARVWCSMTSTRHSTSNEAHQVENNSVVQRPQQRPGTCTLMLRAAAASLLPALLHGAQPKKSCFLPPHLTSCSSQTCSSDCRFCWPFSS